MDPLREKQIRQQAYPRWASLHPDVVVFLTAPGFDAEGSPFLQRLADEVGEGLALMAEQTTRVRDNITRRAMRDAPPGELDDTGRTAAPTGRVEVTGRVVAVQNLPDFHADRPQYLMTLDCGEFALRCVVPKSLLAAGVTKPGDLLGLRDAHVSLEISLTPLPHTAWLARGSNPRHVRLLSLAAIA